MIIARTTARKKEKGQWWCRYVFEFQRFFGKPSLGGAVDSFAWTRLSATSGWNLISELHFDVIMIVIINEDHQVLNQKLKKCSLMFDFDRATVTAKKDGFIISGPKMCWIYWIFAMSMIQSPTEMSNFIKKNITSLNLWSKGRATGNGCLVLVCESVC